MWLVCSGMRVLEEAGDQKDLGSLILLFYGDCRDLLQRDKRESDYMSKSMFLLRCGTRLLVAIPMSGIVVVQM